MQPDPAVARVRSSGDPGAWVRQVASRLAVSRWRRTKTALNFLARSRDPEPAAAPDETSVVLVKEVARIEGCPEGTIKARLSRGRAALATRLAPSESSEQSSNGAPTPLADGVTLFTFELDQKNGHGAIWLAANEDHNVIYTMHGAATPLPDGAGEKVGQELLRELNVPWGPAQ